MFENVIIYVREKDLKTISCGLSHIG